MKLSKDTYTKIQQEIASEGAPTSANDLRKEDAPAMPEEVHCNSEWTHHRKIALHGESERLVTKGVA